MKIGPVALPIATAVAIPPEMVATSLVAFCQGVKTVAFGSSIWVAVAAGVGVAPPAGAGAAGAG